MSKLFVGVDKQIITPKIGGNLYGYNPTTYSTSVHDDLTVTAFYLEQDETKVLFISATVCIIGTPLADEIREIIANRLSVPLDNIILSATHTHSGPTTVSTYGWGDVDREYCDSIFIPRIIEACERAANAKQAASMAVARGKSDVGINRRELTTDNGIALGQSPWGCYNPEMTVISFKSGDKVIGNIVHYGAHGTAAGNNHEISRDWSGIMTDRIEQISGGITAFFNGPEGDVGPRLSNGRTVGDITYVEELGAVAADDAERIYSTLGEYSVPRLGVLTHTLELPLKKLLPLEVAIEKHKQYEGCTVNINAQKERFYASIIQAHENGYKERDCAYLKQSALVLGGVAFLTFPYELFSEIGMRIDRAVKDYKVLPLSNTNGSKGYLPTQDQIIRGGYEIGMFLTSDIQPYVDDADFHIVKQCIKLFNE